MLTDCVFCKIIAHQIPATIIAENDKIMAIKDIAPKASIHYVIMPKKHYKDLTELDNCCLASSMIAMAQQIAQDNPDAQEYKLVINNGYNVGQRVFHLHMHFLAGSDHLREMV